MYVVLQIIFHSCKLFSKRKEKKEKKKKKKRKKRKERKNEKRIKEGIKENG
jgi:hypothetical protein